MKNSKKLLLAAFTLAFASSSIMAWRGGGWGYGGGWGGGYWGGPGWGYGGYGYGPTVADVALTGAVIASSRPTDPETNRINRVQQNIKHHENAIKELDREIKKIRKDKHLSSDEKNKRIAEIKVRIKEHQKICDSLYDKLD